MYGPKRRPLIERFKDIGFNIMSNGCWEWLGAVSGVGYGQIYSNEYGGAVNAHRVSYEHYRKKKIPTGMQIDHLCRNRICINPYHLEPVTSLENNRRAAKFRTHCPQGHEFTPENIYSRPSYNHLQEIGLGRECRICRKIKAKAKHEERKRNGYYKNRGNGQKAKE